MTRWLVLGGTGMLGSCVVQEAGNTGAEVNAPPRSLVDLRDKQAIRRAVSQADLVVNCAGWTDVDGAESHPDEVSAVEDRGVADLADACSWHGIPLLQVSTDYVFDGTSNVPYREDAPTSPASVYGRAKATAERHVLATANGYVVRTAWLYANHGRNFVNTILALADTRPTLDVVTDQTGQPTPAGDVARRLVELGQLAVDEKAQAGVYHATCSGATTWFGFARAVFERAGLDPERIRPTTTDALGRPAKRPAYSVLSHDGWAQVGLPPLRDWLDALNEHLAPGRLRLA